MNLFVTGRQVTDPVTEDVSVGSVAASLLRQRGFADVSDLIGGFDAWKSAGGPVATKEKK